MSDCQQDTVSADITAAGYLFRASGYVVTFDGFTTLYEEATDEKEKKETALPPLEEGKNVVLIRRRSRPFTAKRQKASVLRRIWFPLPSG